MVLHAEEITLIDTTTQDSLDWQTYSENAPAQSTNTWRETNMDFYGQSISVYFVCKVGEVGGTNNWLRTPFIKRDGAHRMHIEIKFTMRKCDQYPDPLKQCYTTFNLLYYEADTDFANQGMPTWDEVSYTRVDTIAADKIYSDSSVRTEDIYNTEVRDVPVSKGGLYFAIQDTGACIGVLSIRVFHVRCPQVTINFAMFDGTATGYDEDAPQRTLGVCVNNAAMAQQPTYLCLNSGVWFNNAGRCECMPGYEPKELTACQSCPVNTYKWSTNSERCHTCPAHSHAYSAGSVECECDPWYYRAVQDPKSKACTQPPSAPRNLNVTAIDQTTVHLAWDPPSSYGGREDLNYKIMCVGCSKNVVYDPRQNNILQLRATISGLMSGKTYRIQVFAQNGVTSISSVLANHAEAQVTTARAVPAKIENFRLIEKSSDWISLSWKEPVNKIIRQYEIRYHIVGKPSNATVVSTKETQMTFYKLNPKTQYSFIIRAKTHEGWSAFTDPLKVMTISEMTNITPVDPQTGDNPVGIIAGSIVAVIVCLAIVVVMVVIFLRRNHRACDDKNPSECDALHYSNGEVPVHMPSPPVDHNGGFTIPLFTPPGAVRTYIDPHTYEDPQQAVREFTKEIDASLITIESVIGGGEFGDVCKGKFRMPGKGEMTVAIKTLKPGASEKNRLDFLTEASIMGQFEDNNVIYLEGVVTKSNPIMIVTEYMENGSLDAFLRANDGKFTVIQLVGMMRGISCGMRYLSEMGYVHRDLAARNILVNDTLVCKVADFGLSREIEVDTSDGAYTTKGGKIPVRWTAPEAIAYRKFTSASDVWSYGVCMWEVMAYGERPYWNWSNQDVIKAVDKGYRLPPPMDCPEALHQLMLDCWAKERGQRPKFASIVKTLDKLIRAPELLRKIAKPRPQNILDPSMPDMTQFSSVEEWLINIKMERYIDSFLTADYHSMEQVSRVTMKDLVTLGITLVGHQKKIMNSVQTLRAQLDGAQVSAGFLV